MSMDRKKTPLNDVHRELGGKMVDFAGWDMPVEYSGLRAEHMATRESIGLFDVSHMGEILVEGSEALRFLQTLLTNDVSKCAVSQAQYNLMLNENGGVIDDLIIYRLEDQKYLLVVNASNKDKDFSWISSVATKFSNVKVQDVSAEWGQLAVQGPKATELVRDLFPESLDIKKFRFKVLKWQNADWFVARTGYTGEDGFEIYGPASKMKGLWTELMAQGASYNITPCGLGARNTLRIEAGLPLYGNEIDDIRLPLNIGMNWAIKTEKEVEFFGQKSLKAAYEQGAESLNKKLVGLISQEKAVPRDGYRVLSFDKTQVGTVTSGTYSPSLNQPIAMALVDKAYSNDVCLIEVRKNLVEAKVVDLPFIKKK